MSLLELVRALPDSAHPLLRGSRAATQNLEISSLAYDSREVRPGALFFCVTGFERDGHEFAAQAIERGAAALVVERPVDSDAPEVEVASVRAAMGPIADAFYDHPSSVLQVLGVTGTNGKTTTAFLVRALLERAGVRCGLLGTVKSVVGGREQQVLRTTPEAIDLQADLRAMLDAGDDACAMEVSSHALALGRTGGVRFAVAVFTNLTQDHLDFHRDMDDYFEAKRRLFTSGPGAAVVNVGDPYGRRLAAELPDALTFAVEGEVPRGNAPDYLARDVECGTAGSRFVLEGPEGPRSVSVPLAARFNVANALGALVAARALGLDLDTLVAALGEEVSVPGRLERVDEGQPFTVLVDYAHTPDSLARVLSAARELAADATAAAEPNGNRARVLCVFGAGGDRDRGKRPLMGEAAARTADVVIVTSDNPRSEDPDAIIADVLEGVARVSQEGSESLHVTADRHDAIARSLELARAGDVVVIAGKGHEQGQELADGRTIPFDDVSVARELLRGRAPQERRSGSRA